MGYIQCKAHSLIDELNERDMENLSKDYLPVIPDGIKSYQFSK